MDVPRDIKRSPTKRLNVKGFGVVLPEDRLPEELLQIARNIRIYRIGEIRVRPGLEKISANPAMLSPVHSLISLNDPVKNANRDYTILSGAGNKLYIDDASHTTFSALQQSGTDLIFSGNKLNFVIARPFQSADPWSYVGDTLLTIKVRSDAINFPWGTSPPLQPLQAKIGSPVYKIISDFEAINEAGVNWITSGTASALAATARISAIPISRILFDEGTTGWACVVPATFPTDIQPGMLITTSANVETVKIDSVYEQITSTTISSITYDNILGPGLCTIQPAIAVPNLKKDMLLSIAGENIRIISVTESIDGTVTSFRCSTTLIHAIGESIDGFRSFRCYFSNTHTTIDTISTNCLSFNVAAGTGFLDHLLAIDLSNVLNRPITDEDDFHISLQVSDPSQVQEIRLIFDLDPSINDFTHNALFKAFRPSDLTSAISGGQTLITAQRTALSRAILERRDALLRYRLYDSYFPIYGQDLPLDPELPDNIPVPVDDPTSGQTGLGTNQWSELFFKRKDLQRIGTDTSRDLKDVKGIRIQILATNTVTVKVDALTVGGTFGPHSPATDLTTLPYYYAYRYRSSFTGTKSNFSPSIRSGLLPSRDSIVLTPVISTDPQIDKIDYIRFGGSIQEWQIIGTGENLPGITFTDTLPDSAILGKQAVNLTDDFQPFPTIDVPRKGTCNVNGTTIKRISGDQFNTSWAMNSDIYIDGVRHTLYTSPTDADTLELNENAGTQFNVTFYLPEPTILASNLPSIWGPFGGAIFGDVIFACRDPYQPGVLFYTSPGDPDSTRDIFQLEICSGSEQLMNGCIFRGRCYVASNSQWYEVTPRFGYGYSIVDNLGAFIAQDTANTRGLFAANCLTVGDLIYYCSQDGIYAYDGGQEVCISTDLYPLFPHDGIPGQVITLKNYGGTITIIPPDFSKPEKMQLEFYDNLLHWTYEDINSQMHTLVYSTILKGWNSEDTFTPAMHTVYGVQREGAHSLLYGGEDGFLYKSSPIFDTDNGSIIQAHIRTGLDDLNDPRVNKQIYEGWVDIGNIEGLVNVGSDDFSILSTPSIPLSLADRTKQVIDLNNGEGIVARNIGLEILYTKGSVFGWEFSFSPLPEDTFLRATSNWTDLGKPGAKRVQGIWIEAQTSAPRELEVQADGITIATLTIDHPDLITEKYYAIQPFIANEVRLLPSDINSWRYFKEKYDAAPYPDLTTVTPDFTDDNDIRPKWLQGFLLEADTNGLDVEVELQGDHGQLIQTFIMNHNGREVKDYSLTTPFITHEMRLVPKGPIRIGQPFKEVQWRWEPEPPLVLVYETQPTTFDLHSFCHLGQLYIVHRSTHDLTIIITVDSVEYSYTIPGSSGDQGKTRFLPQAVKGKIHSFRIESSEPFRIYQKDCEVLVGEWGRQDSYKIAKPFGDLSRVQGATI